ncbi:MAG: HlyC/CorC family transporter [Deltaproteobacteria bacterium]|nr:HlyC/CorC family transporter [Deltaproteobacteria bacterium]
MTSIGLVLVIAFFVLLEGLFSGGEIALVSADINRIKFKAESGSRSAQMVLKLLDNPEWFLSTTLTGTNLCVVTNTTIATTFFITNFGPTKGELLSVAVMIPVLLMLGEIIPKSIFQQRAEAVALRISWFIMASSWLFYPLVYLVSKISRGAVYMLTKRKGILYGPFITRSGLEFLLKNGAADSDILRSEQEMIQRIFSLPESTAEEIMAPLSKLTALPESMTVSKAAMIFNETGYTRIPLYRDTIFNIVGVVHSFDVLDYLHGSLSKQTSGDESIGTIARRNILYAPEMKPSSELLMEMQKQSQLMAIIVDEYGGATGIVTVEDILEEIVGEIDESPRFGATSPYRKTGTDRYLVRAQVKLDHLRQFLPLEIPEGDYETLGGFLLQRMGRIPRKKESLQEGDVLFVVEDADMKSIKEVLVVLHQGAKPRQERRLMESMENRRRKENEQ